jgi:hypothetical protein
LKLSIKNIFGACCVVEGTEDIWTAWTLGSWVWIPLRLWIYMFTFMYVVLPCEGSCVTMTRSTMNGVVPNVWTVVLF